MNKSYRSWIIYSIAIFIVWIIIFFIRWKIIHSSITTLRDLVLVFIEFFVGWLSATIKFVLVSKRIYGSASLKSEK